MDTTVPEEFIFFLFVDLNEVHYPTYLAIKLVTEYLELQYDEELLQFEQEVNTFFLQDTNCISRNDLQKILRKYKNDYSWFIDELNNLICETIENYFGDEVMCADHYIMWKGKGIQQYNLIKPDVEEIVKLYNCQIHELKTKKQIDTFMIRLQDEMSSESYQLKETTNLSEMKDELGANELWPEEEISYRMELCETIQAEMDAENGENLLANYKNGKIKSEKRQKLKEVEEKLVLENKAKFNDTTDTIYIPHIVNSKQILEQFKDNYNIFKLLELIRKKYNSNIYEILCQSLKEEYMNQKEIRICSLITKLLPLQIRTDKEIHEKLEILEIGYKINTWKKIWKELIQTILKKYEKEDEIEIPIKNIEKLKSNFKIWKNRKKRKSFTMRKRIKPK